MTTGSKYKKVLINIPVFLLIFSMGFCVQLPAGSRTSFGVTINLSGVAYADGVLPPLQETTVLTDNTKSIEFSYGLNDEIKITLILSKDAGAIASATEINFDTSVIPKSETNIATITTCGDQICIAPGEDTTNCALDCL